MKKFSKVSILIIIFLAGSVLFPIFNMLVNVKWDNFSTLVSSTAFTSALKNSLFVGIISTITSIFIAYILAYGVNKVIKNTVRDVAKNGKVQNLASATRNVARNARPYASRVGSKIGGAASKAKGTFGRFVNKMGSKFGRKGSDVVRNGMSTTLNSGTIEILDEAGETIFKGSKYSITDVKGLGKATYVVEKFIKLLRKAYRF